MLAQSNCTSAREDGPVSTRSWTTSGAFTAAVTQNNTVQGFPNEVEMSYAVAWRVADVEPGWTRSIDVRVTWDEQNRPNRRVVLSSLRYNREGL